MVRRTRFFNASLASVTLHRLGRNRRLVLRLAWLTLLPESTALPVSSQRRAIVVRPYLSTCLEAVEGGTASQEVERSRQVPRRYTGDVAHGQGNESPRPFNLRIDEFCE